MAEANPPIYLAANPLEAHLLRDGLAAAGIACEIRGALLWGALGEVAADAWPRLVLCDPRDREAALSWLREYEAREAPARSSGPAAEAPCVRCGEPLPPRFAICWQCGADQP
ncbi:MAG TPA: hypothetical protein VFV27_03265 [Nevskiaceae bacterium]|nr:hypothetical protein [Nevskiaceae bacterium]